MSDEWAKKWAADILAAPTSNPEVVRNAVKGMRDLVRQHITSPFLCDTLELEHVCMALLCEAIRSGAFAGPEWLVWRTRLASSPHIMSAASFLAISSPDPASDDEVPLQLPVGLDSVASVNRIADVIESAPWGDLSPLPDTSQTSRAKMPTADAMAAYRIWFATGRPQAEIAGLMSKKIGRAISQGQVSRWLARVQGFVDAGNVLPNLPAASQRERAVDPSQIDLGERRDGLTQRQRGRKSDFE